MYLVKQLTRVLEWTTQQKLNRAQKRSDKANQAFKNARQDMITSNHELQMTQAEILIQLNKLDSVQATIMLQQGVNEKKILALESLINE